MAFGSSSEGTIENHRFIQPSTTTKRPLSSISKRSGKINAVRVPVLPIFPRTEDFDAKVDKMGRERSPRSFSHFKPAQTPSVSEFRSHGLDKRTDIILGGIQFEDMRRGDNHARSGLVQSPASGDRFPHVVRRPERRGLHEKGVP